MVAMAGNGAARNGAAQEREGEGTVRISIVNQYIKDFSFENPGARRTASAVSIRRPTWPWR